MGCCLAVPLGILWDMGFWFAWQLAFNPQILLFHSDTLTEKELINMCPGIVNNGVWLVLSKYYKWSYILEIGKATQRSIMLNVSLI